MLCCDLAYLWQAKNCHLWAVFLDNGQELTDAYHPLHGRFMDDYHRVRRGWLFLELVDGCHRHYMEVYRIDGYFLWRFA